MNNCYKGTNVPNLNEEPCNGNYVDDKCVVHEESIPYLGVTENSSVNTILNKLVLSLIDKDEQINNVSNYKVVSIPTPIVYSSKGTNFTHSREETLPETITDSWSEELLKLTYYTSDLTFLNYNPKFFAFIYKGESAKKSNANHPNLHKNNKTHKSYIHPASFSVSWSTSGVPTVITPLATYSNYSKVNDNNQQVLNMYRKPFNKFVTEWSVPLNSGKETVLTGFNPLRWYGSSVDGIAGKEFFPLSLSNKLNVSVITGNNFKNYPNIDTENISPRHNIFVKFAIVIEDPNKAGGFIIGDMSDTVKISLQSGYFSDGDGINKYFYAWRVKPR